MPKNQTHQIDLDGLARLAKLELPHSERANLLNDLNEIFNQFELLGELGLSQSEPMNSPGSKHCPLRQDRGSRDDEVAAKILSGAPKIEGNLIAVPPVIGRKT